MAEIIIYVDINFGGLHTHIFDTVADFTALSLTGVNTGISAEGFTWNDIVSSFVIVSGQWQFFKDTNFGFQQGNPAGLGPGLYPWVEQVGIDNDSLSSVRLIAD